MATVESGKPKINRIGLTLADYKGAESTLCAGCGHDAITSQIIRAFYEYGVVPHQVAKLSGIGCSSKTPAYFLNRSHGFNSVHGRMPSVGTGVFAANRTLLGIGVTGDGDTAAIGMGQFVHLLRRNVPMIYIIENNGVYGLTKGQFSATADKGSKSKSGVSNPLPAIDCCQMAIQLGCGYVARSFAGDPKQLVALIKGAIGHRGTALIDVISPCVTFNNHPDSTKSYDYAKEHEELLQEIGFVPYYEQISIDYDEGTTKDVVLHDGSHLRLKKLSRDYDPMSRLNAYRILEEARETGDLITGLIYIDPTQPDFVSLMNLVDEPLATLPLEKVRPGREALDEIMEELR
ncbi:MAG TPA: 2-oxoacid:ferredoxin oxidoreductase subunit beta [Acidobacteriota bacterium]|jgi:2-oxoglutarate ferredoxin oxidoreductase subunit beta|nr:2-oxoacid:ferredoxin oxidoreductase subunit beta [Acidobacteriota bacterium]